MTSASYLLAPHVHVCLAGRQVVLLDLERDRYLAVTEAQPLARWIRGWPAPVLPASHLDGRDLLERMLSQGLLVSEPSLGKEAAGVRVVRPETALVEWDLMVRPRTTFAQLRQLFAAYAAARWSLRHRPIKEVVRAAAERKERVRPAAAPQPAALRSLVGAFMYLRPLFYAAHGACLLDSLTLMGYLARHGLTAEWVFGVKTDPFYAHCWVQSADHVLNDTPDHVRGFTPIMVI